MKPCPFPPTKRTEEASNKAPGASGAGSGVRKLALRGCDVRSQDFWWPAWAARKRSEARGVVGRTGGRTGGRGNPMSPRGNP